MQYQGHDIMKINSLFKSTLGLGMIIGLALGTVLIMFGSYVTPFVVFGIVFLLYMPCVVELFPSEITAEDLGVEQAGSAVADAHELEEVQSRLSHNPSGKNIEEPRDSASILQNHSPTKKNQNGAFLDPENGDRRSEISSKQKLHNGHISRINQSSGRSVSQAIMSKTILK